MKTSLRKMMNEKGNGSRKQQRVTTFYEIQFFIENVTIFMFQFGLDLRNFIDLTL